MRRCLATIAGLVMCAGVLPVTGNRLGAQGAESAEEATSAVASEYPAFPGAEGFGAFAIGGRGGKVWHVTNLNDNGPGSLREAVEAEGPRIVVFEVAGYIDLESELEIRQPYITIAGQTAPGDGICVRRHGTVIRADHVVIRYMRFRLGDAVDKAGGGRDDCLSISDGRHIIVDHCSASWSMDEALSASTRSPSLTDITVQWCYITEALNAHGHSFGSLIRGLQGARFTYHHNLYAHNRSRNPRPGNYNRSNHEIDPEGLLLDFRNNVIYNWEGERPGYNADTDSVTRLNYVANYVIAGPDSAKECYFYEEGSHFNRGYFAENALNGEVLKDQYAAVRYSDNNPSPWSQEEIANYRKTPQFPRGRIETEPAVEALESVLRHGGASEPTRDAVDRRIVEDVRNRTGRIIKSQDEVGGWPELKTGEPALDTDRDGMPDAWETEQGLNPADPSDGATDPDGDGYTNIEEYLDWLVSP